MSACPFALRSSVVQRRLEESFLHTEVHADGYRIVHSFFMASSETVAVEPTLLFFSVVTIGQSHFLRMGVCMTVEVFVQFVFCVAEHRRVLTIEGTRLSKVV